MKKLLSIAVLLCALFSLAACSEDEGEVEEFAEWQTTNEAYWNTLYASTLQRITAGNEKVDTIRQWSMQNQTSYSGANISYSPENYIIVEKQINGTGTELAQYSDSVDVYYQGRLIPSTTYTSGYIFDSSTGWNDNYNTAIMTPTTLKISSVVDGFATALLNMHEGDRWTVYIPYQLGYGTSSSSSSSIPAYSTLIFDLTLVKIHKVNR